MITSITASAGGGVDEGEHRKVLTGLQKADIMGNILQILGADTDGFG